MSIRRFGFVVNPIAGMGGRVGLKGTDGARVLEEARRRGAVPESNDRARRALAQLGSGSDSIKLFAAAGAMGEDAARAEGFSVCVIGCRSVETTAKDTRDAVRAMRDLGLDLILFAGGDGTARDIHTVVGEAVAVLGIPTGVKMHSAVFATSPEAAGRLAARLAEEGGRSAVAFRSCEIMDIDETAVRSNRIAARLHGYATVPYERQFLQNAKTAGRQDDDAAVAAAARQIAAAMAPGIAYVVGPGHSAKQVLAALGLEGTLLGIDLVRDRRLVGSDLSQRELLDLTAGLSVRIIIGVIGGQGFLFGRGNHPIGPELIRQAGRNGIIAIAGEGKLATLPDRRLLCDTGDVALDAELSGYLRVITAPDKVAIMKVAGPS
jgi:predicted polyphosphate/ATP-dependent NAD kinase